MAGGSGGAVACGGAGRQRWGQPPALAQGPGLGRQSVDRAARLAPSPNRRTRGRSACAHPACTAPPPPAAPPTTPAHRRGAGRRVRAPGAVVRAGEGINRLLQAAARGGLLGAGPARGRGRRGGVCPRRGQQALRRGSRGRRTAARPPQGPLRRSCAPAGPAAGGGAAHEEARREQQRGARVRGHGCARWGAGGGRRLVAGRLVGGAAAQRALERKRACRACCALPRPSPAARAVSERRPTRAEALHAPRALAGGGGAPQPGVWWPPCGAGAAAGRSCTWAAHRPGPLGCRV